MSGLDYFFYCLKNYANFEGRARRSEYWYYTLFNILAALLLTMVFTGIAIAMNTPEIVFLSYLWYLVTLIPTMAVAARRLHDTDRSGWWQLLAFVPFVGGIVLLVFYCQDSQLGDNPYGPNPKYPDGGFQNPYGQAPYGQSPYGGQNPYGQNPYGQQAPYGAQPTQLNPNEQPPSGYPPYGQ